MSKFLFTYRAPKDYASSAETAGAWSAWFESIAANVLDPGNPVFDRSTLGNVGGDTVLGGYSLISAEDLDAAVRLAKGCPGLAHDFGVEIGELTILDKDADARVQAPLGAHASAA